MCGVLYADDAGVVSNSSEGLAKMMTVIVTLFEAAGLAVSGKKTEVMLLQTRGLPCIPGSTAVRHRSRGTEV